jgi:hypothetical protein
MFTTVADREKRDTSIFIDGIRFVRVHFINCQLIYRAEDDVDFEDCTFDHCDWTLDGAAERMLGFLATLHEKTGPVGKELVEGIFDSIRNKRVTEIRGSAQPQGSGHLQAAEANVETALSR